MQEKQIQNNPTISENNPTQHQIMQAIAEKPFKLADIPRYFRLVTLFCIIGL